MTFHLELHLKQIGTLLLMFLAVIRLTKKASADCNRFPQEFNICTWYHLNFPNRFNWVQDISLNDKSEFDLIYTSNLLSSTKLLLTAFHNSQNSELLQVTARKNNTIMSSIPICFIIFAEYKLVINSNENAFRNHLTQQIANWFNISTDLVNSMVFPYGNVLAKAEMTVRENSKATSTFVNKFQTEIRKDVIAMTDRRNNQLQAATITIFYNEVGSDGEMESHHRRSVRSSSGVPIQLTFNADYGKTVKGREEVFKEHLKKQIAKTIRVPLSSIADMNIRKDKVTADFILMITNDRNNVMDETSVQEAASDLRGRIHSGKLKVTDLDSNILQVVAAESIVKASFVSAATDLTPIILGVVIGVFLLMFVLVILAAIIVQHVNKSCSRSISPYGKRSTYETFQNEDGRDSINSIGKYSYDSGVWIGPGPEPKRKVPEAPLYRPPTVLQVRETPRPCTAVRVRLKDNWNIDPEATFGSTLEESLKE